MNKLLQRQIQKYFGGLENTSEQLTEFLKAVSDSYDHYEKDHKMLERTIDLSSSEMIELNKELREETKKLKIAHHELKTLFENIDETYFSVDVKLQKITQMSPMCEELYGYTPEAFFADSQLWKNVVHPDDRAIFDRLLQDLSAGKSRLDQYRIFHRNGSVKWVESRIITTIDQDNGILRLDGITYDITERKHAEELLIESEKKYRLVFENPFLGVALGTIDGRVANANASFCDLLEYSQEEIQNVHFSTFTHPDDVKKELPFIMSLMKGETDTYQLEKRYITKSNKILWVELSVTSVKNEIGEVQFVIAVIQDITTRKYAERSLIKSEANLRNILETTDVAYVLLDEKANILVYNKVASHIALNMAGEALEEGKSYFDFLTYIGRTEEKEHIENILRKGEGINYETAFTDIHNSVWWFYISMHPVFGDDHTVLGLSVAAADITERKKTEVQIKQSNERYELVTKATNDVIWDWDIVHNKKYRSANYTHVFGYSSHNNSFSSELWGKNIHPDDKSRVEQSIAEKTNDPNAVFWESDYRYYRASGELAFVKDRAYIIRDEELRPVRVVGAMKDVTIEKLFTIERDKITADLVQRNRDLEQFAYIVSHNLRSPVANILGLTNLIKNNQLSETEHRECLKGLFLSVNKLDSVIIDINYILQVRRETNEKKEPVSFSELVDDIKISVHNLIQKENAVIETDFDQTDQYTAIKSYIYSIFFNLITNSIKYRNGINPVIRIRSQKTDNKILLRFKDNGLGIDLKTQKDKIFGLYNRFHFHTEGKGMGLYMIKTQVEILGGKISVNSEINKGAEFIVELPVTD